MEIKWIKLSTDLFNNRKIKQIECLPDGYAVIVVWLKLLCLAGTINDDGLVYLTHEIPYTEQMMAQQFGMPLNTVNMALEVFERFGMIEIIDDMLHISNWERYQNIEGMERVREQNRIRNIAYRERKKAQIEQRDVTTTSHDGTDKNRLEEDKKRKDKKEIVRHKYGSYQNVLLSDEQYTKLKNEFPDYEVRIERLSEYIASTGKTYKDHLATIRSWAKRDKDRPANDRPKYKNFEERKTDYDALFREETF